MKASSLRNLSFSLACLLLAGCVDVYTPTLLDYPPAKTKGEAHSRRTTETLELTILTYNVAALSHGGDRTAMVAEFIGKLGADYVGLNELDSCNNRHNVFQLKELADLLGGWNYHFASAFPFAGGGYGNGAMTPYPLLSATTVPLSRGVGHEPRSIAVVETEDIVFGAVHLDFGPPNDPARDQAEELNAWFNEHYAGYGKPVILCGDFNDDPGTPSQKEMEKYWTRLSDPVRSWPTTNPTMCCDYVFYLNSAVPVEAVETARPEGIIDLDAASDHYPVRVKIRFTRKRTIKPATNR